jgi:hypothetical protein
MADSKFSAANFTVDTMVEKERKELSKEREAKERERAARDEAALEKKKESAAIRLDTEKSKMVMKEDFKKEKNLEDAEKKFLMVKIEKYLDRFPEVGKTVSKPKATASLEEVKETYRLVRLAMDTKLSLESIKQYVLILLGVIENAVGDGSALPPFVPVQYRLDLRGLSALFQTGQFKDDFDPIIQEWDIEYPWLGQTGLYARTFAAVAKSCVKAHLENAKARAVGAQAPVAGMDNILRDL